MQLKMRHIFVCVGLSLLYNTIRDKFSSLFHNVVLEYISQVFFFQYDREVDNRLDLTKATALRHFKELVGLKLSWCSFSYIISFDFMDFNINFVSFIVVCY